MIATEKNISLSFWRFVERHKPEIEGALEKNLPLAPPEIMTQFNEAVRYLIFPGGKRLRPALTLLAAELVGGEAEKVIHAAVAVEYIHTSSIIFDDLPCMDNSPHRRGDLSLHEKYGEGLAILVAIGFLNQSYRLVTIDRGSDPGRSIDAVMEIVDCVGPAGMVGGQSIDLIVFGKAEPRTGAVRGLRDKHNLKTSALIRLSLKLGAIHSGANDDELAYLSSFADLLGHAYQISDDLVDAEQDNLTIAIDEYPKDDKPRPTSLREEILTAAESAKSILIDHFAPSEARDCLMQLVDYVATRKD